MSTNRARLPIALASASITTVALGTQWAAADSGVPATDYGENCVIDPGDFSVTLDSLRARCSLEQQNAIFSDASAGTVPNGPKHGWVISPAAIQPIAPAFWTGKTFYTVPDGGHLMNQVSPAGVEGFRADVNLAPAITDGAPAGC